MKNILDITRELNIPDDYVIPFGWDKAKIDLRYKELANDHPNGKLVLVTAITPTKAGEGKTTTTIGLHDGLRKIGVNSLAVLREPSLGPVFGVKGGAVGALKSTIVPSDDINLHFTGDFHALTSTINLIAAVIENSIYQGNNLNINPDRIVWTRALDMNDRSIRSITVNANGSAGDDPDNRNLDIELEKLSLKGKDKATIDQTRLRKTNHKSEFVITVASELMAIFCIANDEEEFLDRTENIIVAYTYNETPVTVKDLHIRGAIKKLMHTAMNPNVVQTLEENPVLVHGGPFANIAHGCNSVIATKLGLKLADVVVTEAGFGSDLGAEKFLDIKCQRANLKPNAIVLVATVRALKLHGGILFEDLEKENVEAMLAGACNLKKHYENMNLYGVPVIISINRFPSDTDAEIAALRAWCEELGATVAVNTAALNGGDGAAELATKVMHALDTIEPHFKPLYPIGDNTGWSIRDKIGYICQQIYGAGNVVYTDLADEQINRYQEMGYTGLAVCMAKTPNSLTDDAKVLGAPTGFTVTVREVRLSAGAGFIVPLTGAVMTMPGLPKEPLACKM
jgi:formate--tetrahydrofolate ligase